VAEENEELDIIELEESLADVEKPPELPAGLYQGEIQDVQVATSAKGNQYYAIRFVVPPEEILADLQDQFEDGAILYWNRQVKPTAKDRRALFNLRRFIEAIGLDAETTTINPNDGMGCSARLRVRQTVNPKDPASGKRAEIQAIEPLEGAPSRRTQVVEEEEETAPAKPARRVARR